MLGTGNANPAWLGQSFQPGCDVDPVAKDVVILEYDVAEIDADPELNPAAFRHIGGSIGHVPLDLDGAMDRLDGAGKFGKRAVAHRLDDTLFVFSDPGLDHLFKVALEGNERACLVLAHETAVADHVGGKNRRKPAMDLRHRSPPHEREEL